MSTGPEERDRTGVVLTLCRQQGRDNTAEAPDNRGAQAAGIQDGSAEEEHGHGRVAASGKGEETEDVTGSGRAPTHADEYTKTNRQLEADRGGLS